MKPFVEYGCGQLSFFDDIVVAAVCGDAVGGEWERCFDMISGPLVLKRNEDSHLAVLVRNGSMAINLHWGIGDVFPGMRIPKAKMDITIVHGIAPDIKNHLSL